VAVLLPVVIFIKTGKGFAALGCVLGNVFGSLPRTTTPYTIHRNAMAGYDVKEMGLQHSPEDVCGRAVRRRMRIG
jgi:hypothetical protein